jgi:hypothetical protein
VNRTGNEVMDFDDMNSMQTAHGVGRHKRVSYLPTSPWGY